MTIAWRTPAPSMILSLLSTSIRRVSSSAPAGARAPPRASKARPTWWCTSNTSNPPARIMARSGLDPEALEAEGPDGVAPGELVGLLLGEAGLHADVAQDLLRMGEGRIGVGVVGLEADLVHADDVAV